MAHHHCDICKKDILYYEEKIYSKYNLKWNTSEDKRNMK